MKTQTKEKVLGLDLGTNSIGWAVIGRNDDNSCVLLDKGVHIFQDGVAHDKSGERPAVQERTAARASRRHYFRRRLRKIELLKVLVENGLCPHLTDEQLKEWKEKKVYPLTDDFMRWQHSDNTEDGNPYHDRYAALARKLNLADIRDRYILGRALYHINQRRGFLSNRKESGRDSENGKVMTSISHLSEQMREAGCQYLGEFFYKLFRDGEKVRCRYTAREEHYRAEFDAICRKQGLEDMLKRSLERAIFYQRPLKSQKGTVGSCSFEKGKPRCPVSHPRYEEFRMAQFINSIRVGRPYENDFSCLSDDEKEAIRPLFFRKSKPDFEFEDIAKKIAGKGNYAFADDGRENQYRFNYRMSVSVSACPVTAAIINALDLDSPVDWEIVLCSVYTKGEGKTSDQILNDVWHALFSFDDESMLSSWLRSSLQLTEEKADALAKIRMPQGYASLSLKAINKILPCLKKGYIYSDAVFYANLPAALPPQISGAPVKMDDVIENVRVILDDFSKDPTSRESSKIKNISDYLLGLAEGVHPERLYHPSMIEAYQAVLPDEKGRLHLGSPRIDSVRNPMAMRALFRLRALLNSLLDEGVIDADTKVNIEFARELNDSNMRKAIADWQKEKENQRKKDSDEIRAIMGENYEPTEDDLLKYRLYEEQKHVCPYTGRQITPRLFLGNALEFDIEHTVPRSRGGDDSQANKTLCDSRFNREVKKAQLPSALEGHEQILQRIAEWKDTVESLEVQMSILRRKCKSASSKDEKDLAIRRLHYLRMKRDYWKGKYDRFTMTSVPEGFSNRQGVDIGIIGRYARMYLKTMFKRIYVVKGATTADFRKAWGLQGEYAKKERVSHSHHCIDAITIACIGKNEYDTWAQYMRKEEDYRFGKGTKPHFQKPWATFTEDVLTVSSSLLTSHYTPDNLPKLGKKKIRVRGAIQRNGDGEPMYAQGHTARALLHKDTFYGAIKKDEEIRYVIRKAVDSLDEKKDVPRIVDDAVREKVQEAIAIHGSLKKAVAETIWMNREKNVPIRKVRVYAPTITSPIALKAHRDQSDKEHKQKYYVANDSNYCMAIYGDEKPSFKLFNALAAVNHFNGKQGEWVETHDAKGRPLRCVVRPGTMVLFYEKSPKELYGCSQEDLSKRLYEVTGLSSMTIQGKYHYGTLTLKHHLEARPSTELKEKKGLWESGEALRPVIGINHNQTMFLVEGQDFVVSISGRIRFLMDRR